MRHSPPGRGNHQGAFRESGQYPDHGKGRDCRQLPGHQGAAFWHGGTGSRAVAAPGRAECGGGADTAVREGKRPCRA